MSTQDVILINYSPSTVDFCPRMSAEFIPHAPLGIQILCSTFCVFPKGDIYLDMTLRGCDSGFARRGRYAKTLIIIPQPGFNRCVTVKALIFCTEKLKWRASRRRGEKVGDGLSRVEERRECSLEKEWSTDGEMHEIWWRGGCEKKRVEARE